MDGDLPHQHKTGGRVAIAGNSREQGVIVEEGSPRQAPLEESAFEQTPLQFFVALTCAGLVLF